MALGLSGLIVIRKRLALPFVLSDAFFVLVLTGSLLPLFIVPNTCLQALGFGYLCGLATLIMEPHWAVLRETKQYKKLKKELAHWVLLSLVAFFVFMSIKFSWSDFLTAQPNHKFWFERYPFAKIILMALVMFLIMERAYRQYLRMVNFLCALRIEEDFDGARSASIVLSCSLLWPAWLIYAKGDLICGEKPFGVSSEDALGY